MVGPGSPLEFHLLRERRGIVLLIDTLALGGEPLVVPGLYRTSFMEVCLIERGGPAWFSHDTSSLLEVHASDVVFGHTCAVKE